MRKLSEMEKISILKNYDTMSLGRISELLNRSRSTIYFFHKKWIRTQSILNIKHEGKKPKLSQREIKRLEAYVTANPLATLERIKRACALPVHTKTVSRYLKKLGFGNYKYLVKPKISNANKGLRMAFVNGHINWSNRRWRKVLFSDESSVELWKLYQRRVWRKRGEAMKPGCFLPSAQKFGKKYMKVWSCFSYNGVGTIVFVDGRLNRYKYRDILSNNLVREGRRLIGNDFVFMEDNDTVHKSGIVATWQKRNKINVLKWPAQSSDMNPLENLWFILKKRLALRRYSNEQEFKEIVQQEWNSIDVSICRSLIDSMPRRLRAVRDSNGDVTKY
jgi:transposase